MSDLDEMKNLWASQDKKLDATIRLNHQMLRSVTLMKAHSATQRTTMTLSLEAVIWFAIVASLGSFIFHHITVIRLSFSAIAFDGYAIAMLAATIRQIVSLRRIDYSRPIAEIQKELEMLRILRIRVTQWALLGGAVVWAPFVIVTAHGLLGLDIVNPLWLGINVAFGLWLILLALWISKAFGERMGSFPFMQRVMNDFAGRNLNDAAAFLSKLTEFEADVQR